MKSNPDIELPNLPSVHQPDYSHNYLPKSFLNYLQTLPLKERLPVARQFFPSTKETRTVAGFTNDPLYEDDVENHLVDKHQKPFIHKYPDRLLYLCSKQCPLLCRYCTRKRRTFSDIKQTATPNDEDLNTVLQYIKQNPKIREIIFSGGDPFMLSKDALDNSIQSILNCDQIMSIRIHSRAITILPEKTRRRFLPTLKNLANKYPEKKFTLVCHVNHLSELSENSLQLIRDIRESNWTVKNQIVLLKNVNDKLETMQALILKLARSGVVPYYIHQLDQVHGSAHFKVPLKKGKKILSGLSRNLPFCMIPAYVKDGKSGKIPINY